MEKNSFSRSKPIAWLSPGDPVLVLSPAYTAKPDLVESGLNVLKNWGLQPIVGQSVSSVYGPFSGDDAIRFADMQAALDHPTARAIFCTRGGYGITRFVDQLDWSQFEKTPKWLIGFSDVTALHLSIQSLGFPSVHGPMVVHLGRSDFAPAVEQLRQFLFNGAPIRYTLSPAQPITDAVEGRLTGGNLTLLINSLGTTTEIQTGGTILFLEEVGERYYRIDRMLQHLFRAGKLSGVKGVILGQFTECEPDGFPFSLEEMVRQKIPLKVPVFSGLEAGHGAPSFPIIHGALAHLKKSDTGSIFTQNLLAAT